ncbi:MAG TPA: glycosyltransferase [Candidatus Tumulicola sp.]|jgi:glycosyltransferase involved in cell wall biosynthesis
MAGRVEYQGVAMNVGIVTTFPEDHSVGKSGVAAYVQTILDPLLGDRGDTFVILADTIDDGRLGAEEQYAPNVTVRRCWRFGHTSPLQILAEAMRHRFDVLHVEWEPYLFGGVVASLLLPFVLAAVRARGTRIVTTVHSVVPLSMVTREMLRENGFVLPYSRIGRLGFKTIYGLLNWASDRLIVLDVELATVLEREYLVRPSKLFVCPLPLMHETARPDMREARRRLGIGDDKVALFFGYASYYKGLDVLLDALDIARRTIPDITLHIIAGQHPRLRGEARYEAFYRRLRERASASGAVWHDRYVPEPQLAEFMSAADVIVLPYTVAYGASSPLHAAFAARKPVLVSTYLRFEGALPCQLFAPDARSCAAALVDYFERNAQAISDRVEDIARMHDRAVIARMIHDVRTGRPCNEAAYVPPPPATTTTSTERR